MYYGFEPNFWLKLFLFLGIFGLILFLFNIVMRKLLRVEKANFLSYNHLNEKHKKLDWIIRITFIIVLLIGFSINTSRGPMEEIWFLEPYFVLFISIIATETARAYMQWKYDTNRNAYIFTISQLVFFIILYVSLYTTNFFGWFE